MSYYRREIDGLRALAVLPVILFHAGFDTLSGGYVGVDVFFVISGYLITSIIIADKEAGTFSLAHFYERRARRILPALFLVMAVCTPIAWVSLLQKDMTEFSVSLAAVSLFLSNHYFLGQTGYFDSAAELKPMLHTWSLAVEEQYYLLFPLFIMIMWRLGKRWIAGALGVTALLSLSLAHWGAYIEPEATFFILLTRGWELAIGAFVAFYFAWGKPIEVGDTAREVLSGVGLALILYAVFAFSRHTPFPSLYALVPTVGAALIILFATPATAVGRLLSCKPLVGIGLISYSAYLWHQPLFAFARQHSLVEPGPTFFALLIVLAIVLSYFSWKYVERPFRDRTVFTRRFVFTGGAMASFLFVTFGLAVYTGLLNLHTGSKFEALGAAQERMEPRDYCLRKEGLDLPGSCLLSDGNGNGVALLGDSHAGTLGYGLSRRLSERNQLGVMIRSRGCPPVPGIYDMSKSNGLACNEHNAQAANYVLNDGEIEYVILSARWTLYVESDRFDNEEGGVEWGEPLVMDIIEGDAFLVHQAEIRRQKILDRYLATIHAYLDADKKVILVYDVPEAGWNVPNQLKKLLSRNGSLEAAHASTSHSLYLARTEAARSIFDGIGEHPNLYRVRPDHLFCNGLVENRCVKHHGGIPLYSDDDHLSDFGAALVIDEILGMVQKPSSNAVVRK